MRPGLAILLQVLRDQPPQHPATHAEWSQAFALAEAEHVLPWFCHRLRRTSPAPSPEVTALLHAAETQVAVATFWWTSELRGLLRSFAEADLPVIPLKGPMFADRVYGSANLRSSRDLDLLVRRVDLPVARALLGRLGFVSPAVADDYHQRWNRGTTRVELHRDVENPLALRFDIDGAWRRALPRQFLGQPALQFAPADELLFICLHSVRHRFEQLSQVLDVALALHRLAPAIEPATLLPAAQSDLRQVFAVARIMAAHLDPACLSSPAVRQLHPRPAEQHLVTLCDALWRWTLEHPGVRLDWQQQHAFYLALESRPAARANRRLRHLLILVTRLIQSDYDFAARLGVQHPAAVWVMRQTRLFARLFARRQQPAARFGG